MLRHLSRGETLPLNRKISPNQDFTSPAQKKDAHRGSYRDFLKARLSTYEQLDIAIATEGIVLRHLLTRRKQGFNLMYIAQYDIHQKGIYPKIMYLLERESLRKKKNILFEEQVL